MVYCVMVARQAHVEQVGLLGSKDRATRLTALKAVKNQVRGAVYHLVRASAR